MCATWAESGECDANPVYMKSECAKACSGAKSMGSQIRQECAGYADQGECSRNPAFMLSTCRAECDKWEKSHGLLMDRSGLCVQWSILGKCQQEPERMGRECNTSCTVQQNCARSQYGGWSVGICDKALRCEAMDTGAGCASRAASGECRSNPTHMAQQCLTSCASVDVDAVLSAHRPEMRARLSSHIDISPAASQPFQRCWLTGWAGHNTHKLMLPTQCAARRNLPWHRKRTPQTRLRGSVEDMLTCPIDVARWTPRVPVRSRRVSMLPHTPHEASCSTQPYARVSHFSLARAARGKNPRTRHTRCISSKSRPRHASGCCTSSLLRKRRQR